MNRYKVTIVIETESHPRKWILETLEQGLYEPNESITEYDIEELINTHEQESECN